MTGRTVPLLLTDYEAANLKALFARGDAAGRLHGGRSWSQMRKIMVADEEDHMRKARPPFRLEVKKPDGA